MDRPDAVDDVARTLSRDKAKLIALQRAADHLESAQSLVETFPNLKQPSGLIVSFRDVNGQIMDLRRLQEKKLYGKMPSAFVSRCGDFLDYMKVLEQAFELKDSNLDGLVRLMRTLKNYDVARDAFQQETDIIDALHGAMEDYKASKDSDDHSSSSSATNKLIQQEEQLVGSKNPKIIYRAYADGKVRLFAAVGRARTVLMGLLGQIKTDTLARSRTIHDSIAKQLETLSHPMFTSGYNISAISTLRSCAVTVMALKKEVNDLIETQLLLVEGHDIIGAANPIFLPLEVDNFPAMAKLDKVNFIHL
jgi:hypothetical protein